MLLVYKNLLATLMITLGIVAAEYSLSVPSKETTILTLLLFGIGWLWFLINDYRRPTNQGSGENVKKRRVRILIGFLIPLVAMYGQYHFFKLTKMGLGVRRDNKIKTVLIITLFMILWLLYVYNKSLDNAQNIDKYQMLVNGTGLMLLMGGMILYFMGREHNIGFILGTSEKRTSEMTIFNPSLVFVSFGWVFLAMGNSV